MAPHNDALKTDVAKCPSCASARKRHFATPLGAALYGADGVSERQVGA